MELTNEQLDQVREMAAALMPAGEIAILLGLGKEERDLFVETCRSHERSPLYLAYRQGVLRTKYELKRTVIKLAKCGSPAAQPLAEKYLKEYNNL